MPKTTQAEIDARLAAYPKRLWIADKKLLKEAGYEEIMTCMTADDTDEFGTLYRAPDGKDVWFNYKTREAITQSKRASKSPPTTLHHHTLTPLARTRFLLYTQQSAPTPHYTLFYISLHNI